MAAAIEFLDTPKIGYARVTTGVTATDGSGSLTSVTWYGGSAPAGNWMLTKVIALASSATGVGNPADSLLHIFVTDGTTPRRLRTIDIGDPAVGSVSVPEGQWEIDFGHAFIFPSTISLLFGVSVTPTAGNIDCLVIVQDA